MEVDFFYLFLVIGCFIFAGWIIYTGTPAYRRKKNPLSEEERPSYIDPKTNEIFLRSYDYPLPESQEWVISNNTIKINILNGRDTSKTVLISKLSGVKVERSKDTVLQLNMAYLKLYIGGGTTSAVVVGSGGVSGQANYTLTLDQSSLEMTQKAHDYIIKRIEQSRTVVEPVQITKATQSVADELVKLKLLLDDGILTQEEFEHKKRKLLDI